MSDRDRSVYFAKLAEQAERYDEMSDQMALVGESGEELSVEELRSLSSGGIPHKYRQTTWTQLFSAQKMGCLDSMVGLDSEEILLPEGTGHQIDLDVPRTRSRSLSDADKSMLRWLLRAYAKHDPEVGYCQGMGDIAVVFVLQGYEQAEALRALNWLVTNCCPNYFCPSLKGYVRDVSVLEVLIREFLPPELVQKLDALKVPVHTLAADHFLTLASHTWPLPMVLRLWDVFFVAGSRAVFASFLALLEMYLPEDSAESRRASDGPEQVEIFMNAVSGAAATDLDSILERSWKFVEQIPPSRIESLRYVFSA